METPSPAVLLKRQETSRLELCPPSVPMRLIRGREVSVYYNRENTGAWARHQHDQLEIALYFRATVCHLGWCESGTQWREREVRGPHVSVIASGLPHECRLEGDAELLILYVERSLLRRIVRRKISGVMVLADAAQHDVVVWTLAALLRHLCTGRLRPSTRTIDAIGGELAVWLVELLDEAKTSAPRPGRLLTPTQREKVMRYIQANLKHDIHVVDLAKQTGHSLSHFTELFVQTMGRAPYHYLKEVRVLRGFELLLTGDYRVSEVALEVGYCNADHFSEVFRKFCGYSPRELLRRVRTGSAGSRCALEERRDNSTAEGVY